MAVRVPLAHSVRQPRQTRTSLSACDHQLSNLRQAGGEIGLARTGRTLQDDVLPVREEVPDAVGFGRGQRGGGPAALHALRVVARAGNDADLALVGKPGGDLKW
jgi:hypothetical protein